MAQQGEGDAPAGSSCARPVRTLRTRSRPALSLREPQQFRRGSSVVVEGAAGHGRDVEGRESGPTGSRVQRVSYPRRRSTGPRGWRLQSGGPLGGSGEPFGADPACGAWRFVLRGVRGHGGQRTTPSLASRSSRSILSMMVFTRRSISEPSAVVGRADVADAVVVDERRQSSLRAPFWAGL